MSFSIAHRTAIVTGGLGLLGRQHCLALAEAGANVVVADLNPEPCRSFASELSAATSTKSSGFAVDISDPESVAALRDAVIRRYDRIDILVNNAGVDDVFHESSNQPASFENYPLDLWRRCLDVNLNGTFLCCQILGGEMARSRRGSIINVASIYGVVAPDQSVYRNEAGVQAFYKSAAYPVSKAAVIALTRYAAAYWGGSGVRVNALSPGGVENNQAEYFISNYSSRTPMGRMAKADDYGGAIVFLASDASSYMTGANLIVDGGWTIW